MPAPISRSPNDPAGIGPDSAVPSRVSAGAPPAKLRSAPPRIDPADQSTLDMLGSNPLSDPNASLQHAATGVPGAALMSLADAMKSLQALNTLVMGFVPPEIMMWLDNAAQALPQLLQQQQSSLGGTSMAGTAATPTAMLGPTQTPIAPTPGSGPGGPVGLGGPPM